MEEQMTIEDWLDDLCVRFILNLPEEDLGSIPHICFQIEEAHWFYEDFIRVLDPALPHMSLKEFCLRMFQHCPLFANYSIEHHVRAYQEFMQYKTRIPVRGAIMLNHEMDSCVLVRGWKNNSTWSFPRGKINKDETDLDCAIRECWEETGFDVRKAGLVPADEDVKFFDITMRDQHLRMFVFRDVPMDTVFEPQTRNEIGKVAWYNLRDLPAFRKKKAGKQNEGNTTANAIPNASKFYNVAPFLVPLKKWVLSQKKRDIPQEVLQDDVFAGDGDVDELVAAIPQFQEAVDRARAAEENMRNLLQIQEQTSAVLPNGGSSGNNHGAALLSMLQHKESPAAPFQNQYPHTPLDHSINQATQAQSPHHHHHHHHQAQRPYCASFENPPQFPVAPQSQNTYDNSQAYHNSPSHQNPHSHHNPQSLTHHNQSYNNHSQTYNNQQAYTNPPPQYQARPQVHVATNASGFPDVMVSPRQYQAQPQLLHPQPQPPQVQQALLMRGMLGTPGGQTQQSHPVPAQSSQHIAYQQQTHIQQQSHPQQRNHLTSGTDAGPGAKTQPSAHSMGLLNMFKDKPVPQNAPQVADQPHPAAPLPRDKHRSGLLDMFKQGDQAASTGAIETQLPFGALSIASRPQQSSHNSVREPKGVSQAISQSPGFPYADPKRGVSAADMSIARAPEASALPLPNNMLPSRQDASQEQKTQLLSLFGKSKGKEPIVSAADIARPRSRVASIASGAGSQSSRRGSHTPTSLTPADQNFLLNFLRNASRPQR